MCLSPAPSWRSPHAHSAAWRNGFPSLVLRNETGLNSNSTQTFGMKFEHRLWGDLTVAGVWLRSDPLQQSKQLLAFVGPSTYFWPFSLHRCYLSHYCWQTRAHTHTHLRAGGYVFALLLSGFVLSLKPTATPEVTESSGVTRGHFSSSGVNWCQRVEVKLTLHDSDLSPLSLPYTA